VNYEVMHGQRTHFIQAGNPVAACLDALRAEALDDDIQVAPFKVNNLTTGNEILLPMSEVLAIQQLAQQELPTMDLSCW